MRRLIIISIVLISSVFRIFSEETSGGVTPAGIIQYLKEGNARFVSGAMIHPHSGQARREETAKGQKPVVSILGCSDSRASLELIFDTGLGDLFAVRVAGNVADTDEIASLEYGAEHLHTPVILVLGHTLCGAVTAVVNKAELGGSLPKLLDNIIPAAERAWTRNGTGARVEDVVLSAVHENVLQSMADLLEHSTIVSELVKKGEVELVGAVYRLDTGDVDWLGRLPNESALVAQALGNESGREKAGPEPAPSLLVPVLTVIIVPALVSIFVYALFIVLFTGEKRVFKKLRIFGRLVSSFLSPAIVFGIIFLYSRLLSPQAAIPLDPFLSLLIAGAVTLVFVLVFSKSHVTAFKRFFDKLKQNFITRNAEEEEVQSTD
jgi:carbonic anhydrase